MILADIIYLILEIMFGAACFAMAIISDKFKNSKFKLVYLLPGVVSVAITAVAGYDKLFIPLYVACALAALGFFFEKKMLRQIFAVIVVVAAIGVSVLCSTSDAYRAPDYVAEFDDAFAKMKENYVLTDYKDIDFDELYSKYRPMIKEANARHDKIDYCIAWMRFCDEFKDGHVAYLSNFNEADKDLLYERLYGYDYGFSMVRMSDGRIVAVNVEKDSEAEKAGIINGTVILEWNGIPIEEMVAAFDAPFPENIPVKESEDFLRVVYASGQSGDTLTVKYLTGDAGTGDGPIATVSGTLAYDDAEVCEVTLNKLGIYRNRMEDTLGKLLDGKLETNLTVSQINDTTAFIRIDGMGYDSNSYGTGEYGKMYEELKTNLQAQKDAGVTDLIIDLRANTGGDPNFDMTVFRLLFPEGEYVISYNSVWDYDNTCFMVDETTGDYVLGKPNKFTGEGFWGDGKIIVLVSATTISAGDMFTEMISRLDNVTIMGITPSNCSCQAVRGVDMKYGALSFSAVPNLTAEGKIYIDNDVLRGVTIPLDVKVDVDDEFIDAVFNRNEDYVLDKAIELISK